MQFIKKGFNRSKSPNAGVTKKRLTFKLSLFSLLSSMCLLEVFIFTHSRTHTKPDILSPRPGWLKQIFPGLTFALNISSDTSLATIVSLLDTGESSEPFPRIPYPTVSSFTFKFWCLNMNLYENYSVEIYSIHVRDMW